MQAVVWIEREHGIEGDAVGLDGRLLGRRGQRHGTRRGIGVKGMGILDRRACGSRQREHKARLAVAAHLAP